MTTQRRRLNESASGECWYMCRGAAESSWYCTNPVLPGARPSQIDVETFLAEGSIKRSGS